MVLCMVLGWLVSGNQDTCFEMYLSQEGQAFLERVSDQSTLLENVAWQSDPAITSEDVNRYVWTAHQIHLHRDSVSKLPALKTIGAFRYFKVRSAGRDLYAGVFLPVRAQTRGPLPTIRLLGSETLWVVDGENRKSGQINRDSLIELNRALVIALPGIGLLDKDPRQVVALRTCFAQLGKLQEF